MNVPPPFEPAAFPVRELTLGAQPARLEVDPATLLVAFQVAGPMLARTDGALLRVQPLEVLCVSGDGVALSADGSTTARTVCMTLRPPSGRLERANLAHSLPMVIPLGLESVIAARIVIALHEQRDDGTEPIADIADRLAAVLIEQARARRNEDVPEWLRLLRDSLADRLRGPLTLTGLAAEAGVHPVYLARAFRHHLGLPIGRYLRRLRVAAAARTLALSDETSSTVAYHVGCYDQSHLNRLFVREAGITPGTFRDFAQAALRAVPKHHGTDRGGRPPGA